MKYIGMQIKLKTCKFTENVMKMSRLLFLDEDFGKKLDENKNLIAFANGVFDSSTMEFRQGRPDDCISFSTKINYDPVNITFHDDGGDNIREMWYQYYSYYYKDPAQQYISNAPTSYGTPGLNATKQNGFSYNNRDIYEQNRIGSVNDWGYIGENFMDGTQTASGKPPFFRDIQIIGFDQHKYARYILINPLITAWNHDTYDYSQGNGTMQHTMTIRYETVKYLNGGLGKPDTNIRWPDSAHYDETPSPLARPGSTASIFGQGGLLSTGEGIMADLESGSVAGLIGAAQKAGAAYNTFKGKNLRSIVQSEAVSLGKQVISQNGVNVACEYIGLAIGHQVTSSSMFHNGEQTAHGICHYRSAARCCFKCN
jgi:hypothetical protein